MAGRGALRQWRHRRLPLFCSDAVPHRSSPCNHASCCYRARRGGRWRRRRHRACVHRRARWRAPPWGTQRRTRHRRITTVSSTGSFHRRRRRRLRGCQAAGRGTTFGAGCAARRAASAPSPPHLHSTRARSAPSIRAAGTSLPDWESERSSSVARARQGARRKGRAGRWQMERWLVSSAVLRRAWSRPQRDAEARASRGAQKKGRKMDGRIKGGRASTLKGCCAPGP